MAWKVPRRLVLRLPSRVLIQRKVGLPAEVDPFGGTTGSSFLIGRLAGSVLVDHATQGVCCSCRGGHVGDAAASSKRSVMSTALPARVPLTPSRHTAIGVRPASA